MRKHLFASLIATAITLPVQAASFDCTKATKSDELTICSSRMLNDLDVEMSVKYHFLRGLYAMGVVGDMADAQSAWIKKRRKCNADMACLISTYHERIMVLNEQYRSIKKPI